LLKAVQHWPDAMPDDPRSGWSGWPAAR
jgi:hypothetical protein